MGGGRLDNDQRRIDAELRAQFERRRQHLTPETPWAQRDLVLKDDRVNVRVSAAEKEEMTAAADALGLNVSEYLLKLHRIATAMKGEGGAPRRR